MMNTELKNKCKQYEQVFDNAIKLNFMRLSMAEWEKIAILYEQHFNRKIRKSEKGCGNCRLRIVKELGAAYFSEEVKETKKKGRPKKINLDETEQ